MRFFAICTVLAMLATSPAAARSLGAGGADRPIVADTVKIGTYDLEITTDDGTMTGSLSVSRDSAGLKAELVAGGRKPAVKSFVRQSAQYVLTGGHNNFDVTYTLTFARDSVHGSFTMSGGLHGVVAGAFKR